MGKTEPGFQDVDYILNLFDEKRIEGQSLNSELSSRNFVFYSLYKL